MAIDFPSSPSIGQTFTAGGLIWTWDGVAWNLPSSSQVKTADPFNAIVNPSMWVSQENGGVAGTGNGYWPADQWTIQATTTGVVSAQQISPPAGVKSPATARLRCTVTTADTSIAAGEYYVILQPIEGQRCANFKFGTTYAKQSILRFGFKGPAGTYGVTIRNGAANRSYLAQFTITAGQANTDTEQVIIIPGDVSGTWAVDSTVGITVGITLTAGSTFTGVAGWQAGNLLAISGQSNGLATVGNVFELWDVGFYADPDLSGIPPRFILPDYHDTLLECMRYWESGPGGLSLYLQSGLTGAQKNFFKVIKRTTPTLGYSVQSNGGVGTFDARTPHVSGFDWFMISNATGQCYFNGSWTANARM